MQTSVVPCSSIHAIELDHGISRSLRQCLDRSSQPRRPRSSTTRHGTLSSRLHIRFIELVPPEAAVVGPLPRTTMRILESSDG